MEGGEHETNERKVCATIPVKEDEEGNNQTAESMFSYNTLLTTSEASPSQAAFQNGPNLGPTWPNQGPAGATLKNNSVSC